MDWKCKGTPDFHRENRNPYNGACPKCVPDPTGTARRYAERMRKERGDRRWTSHEPEPPEAA
jgi:hypothetical protein